MKELSKRSKKIVDNCIIKIHNNKLSIGEVYNKCVNYYGNSAFCYFIDELERLNMFPDNHSELEGVSDTKRAFFMGNALVVGVIEKIAQTLKKHI